MAFFQVQLKKGTKTIIENVEASDYKDILEFYYKLSTCEVIEIRKWLYKNSSNKKDDGNYIDYKKIKLINSNDFSRIIKIPKVNKTISDDDFLNSASENLIMNGKDIYKMKLF